MRRVAVDRSAGAYTKAVGIRSRREWRRHTISRKELVGITGRLVYADGQEGVLVMGEEVWEEWTGQETEGTDWRKGAKDEWEAKERAIVRGNWLRGVDRDCVYDMTEYWKKGSPGFVTLLSFISNLDIYLIKMICSKREMHRQRK